MKNIISLVVMMLSCSCVSQIKKELYLFIDNKTQINKLEHTFDFIIYVKSKDKRFSHDVYTFTVLNPEQLKNMEDLSFPISLDTINYTRKDDFFRNKKPHVAHEDLSLCRTAIVMEILKKDIKQKSYILWPAIYTGTQKDVIITQSGNPKKEMLEK